MIFRLATSFFMVLALSNSAFSCPSAPFVAEGQNGAKVATIVGNRITDAGWKQSSSGDVEDGYTSTSFKKEGQKFTLVRFNSEEVQPGIIWGVWYEAGMYEGFVNFYDIQTNVRGIAREAKVTKNGVTGHFDVKCN